MKRNKSWERASVGGAGRGARRRDEKIERRTHTQSHTGRCKGPTPKVTHPIFFLAARLVSLGRNGPTIGADEGLSVCFRRRASFFLFLFCSSGGARPRRRRRRRGVRHDTGNASVKIDERPARNCGHLRQGVRS